MLAKGLMVSIYFPNTPATFIHVPRTGGTSFKNWLLTNNINHKPVTQAPWIPKNINIAPDRDYINHLHPNLGTVFTFVRNPFDRVVSLYHYMGQWAESRIKENKSRLTQGLPFVKTFPYQSDNIITAIRDDLRLVEYYNLGFDHWINNVFYNRQHIYNNTGQGTRHIIDHFWRGETQLSWFCDQMPEIVIKTEQLDKKFSIIQQLLGCDDPLPIDNISNHLQYRQYYSPTTQRIIEEEYQEDLTAFEYEF